MSNCQEQKDSEVTTKRLTDRRRLLKLSAAAPLIATLHPGAAMAASSAFQCAGGDFSNKKFEANGNSINGDTAVREEINYYERFTSGGGNALPKKLYVIDGELYDQSGKSHQITAALLEQHYTAGTTYVLVVYSVGDNYIDRLGLWPKYQIEVGQQPLSASCLSSLVDGGAYI